MTFLLVPLVSDKTLQLFANGYDSLFMWYRNAEFLHDDIRKQDKTQNTAKKDNSSKNAKSIEEEEQQQPVYIHQQGEG